MRTILAALFVYLSIPASAMGWSGSWNGVELHNNTSEVAMHIPGERLGVALGPKSESCQSGDRRPASRAFA
jgi:hypothetical protein